MRSPFAARPEASQREVWSHHQFPSEGLARRFAGEQELAGHQTTVAPSRQSASEFGQLWEVRVRQH
jgi:hypothetical protein